MYNTIAIVQQFSVPYFGLRFIINRMLGFFPEYLLLLKVIMQEIGYMVNCLVFLNK